MLTDEQYGRALGDLLRRELADVHAAPELSRTLRRRQARRTWAIRAAIATPVAAAAAVTTVALTTSGQGAPNGGRVTTVVAPPTSTTGPVPVENVAQVQAQTIRAVSQAADYVIYSKSTYGTGYYEIWTDKATQRTRTDSYTQLPPPVPVPKDGKVTLPPREPTLGPMRLQQSNSVSGPEGDQDTVFVDYDLRTWGTGHMTDRRPPTPLPDITDADSIRTAIADGGVELLGNQVVDGLDTLHLRLYGPKREYRIDMWVDAKTYLPVQEIATKSGGGTGEQEFPAAHAVTTKYDWLPRTEQNLTRVTLTPPPGFERIH